MTKIIFSAPTLTSSQLPAFEKLFRSKKSLFSKNKWSPSIVVNYEVNITLVDTDNYLIVANGIPSSELELLKSKIADPKIDKLFVNYNVDVVNLARFKR